MHHLSTQHRLLTNPKSLANNIALHIRQHQIYGKVVIVTANPTKLLGTITSAWASLQQEMRTNIAYNQNNTSHDTANLRAQLHYMQHCTFAAKPPGEDTTEQVLLATPKQVLAWPPGCRTMYVTCPMQQTELHKATAWMPRYGLVVIYQLPKLPIGESNG